MSKQQYSDDVIVSTYRELGTQRAVSEKLGISQWTVCRAMQRSGEKATGCRLNGKDQKQTKVTDAQLFEACKTMTIGEIAEKFGMHRESLPRRFRKIGVYPIGYHTGCADTKAAREYWEKHPDEKRGCICKSVYGDCWHYVEAHKKMCDENHPGFEYAESRTTNPRRVRIKCKKCGRIIERASSTFRQKNIRCDNCENNRKLSETREKLLRILLAVEDYKTPKTCKTCGGAFYSPHSNQLYCSERCKRKAKPKTNSIRKRCRKYGVYYDSAVTRQKVFERDKYICQICGKPTDPNDTSWGIIGPNAPTVDHIIALKNGGAHTWNNVQCAHAICNSYKRDLWADEFEEVLSCLA